MQMLNRCNVVVEFLHYHTVRSGSQAFARTYHHVSQCKYDCATGARRRGRRLEGELRCHGRVLHEARGEVLAAQEVSTLASVLCPLQIGIVLH